MEATKKSFDARLKEISDLYEEGKDCLNSLSVLEQERATWSRVYDIIREFRDIAAVTLKETQQ